MIILTVRTDKPVAELGLYEDSQEIGVLEWEAHRALSTTLHSQIEALLKQHAKSLTDVEGIVAYQGPGSFTGLRIGLSAVNALAYSLAVPVVGGQGESWQQDGIEALLEGHNQKTVMPEYGAEVHITKQRK